MVVKTSQNLKIRNILQRRNSPGTHHVLPSRRPNITAGHSHTLTHTRPRQTDRIKVDSGSPTNRHRTRACTRTHRQMHTQASEVFILPRTAASNSCTPRCILYLHAHAHRERCALKRVRDTDPPEAEASDSGISSATSLRERNLILEPPDDEDLAPSRKGYKPS